MPTRNAPPRKHSRLRKNISGANISFTSFIGLPLSRPRLQRPPFSLSLSRDGAAFYHDDIFFKRRKMCKPPQGYTLSVISKYNIIIPHSPKQGGGPRWGLSGRTGNVSKPRPSICVCKVSAASTQPDDDSDESPLVEPTSVQVAVLSPCRTASGPAALIGQIACFDSLIHFLLESRSGAIYPIHPSKCCVHIPRSCQSGEKCP